MISFFLTEGNHISGDNRRYTLYFGLLIKSYDIGIDSTIWQDYGVLDGTKTIQKQLMYMILDIRYEFCK